MRATVDKARSRGGQWIIQIMIPMDMIVLFKFALFFNGAVNKLTMKYVVRWVVYDNEDRAVPKIAKWKDGDVSLIAELLAIEKALNLAIQRGWKKTYIFRDSKIAIDSISKAHLYDSS